MRSRRGDDEVKKKRKARFTSDSRLNRWNRRSYKLKTIELPFVERFARCSCLAGYETLLTTFKLSGTP